MSHHATDFIVRWSLEGEVGLACVSLGGLDVWALFRRGRPALSVYLGGSDGRVKAFWAFSRYDIVMV